MWGLACETQTRTFKIGDTITNEGHNKNKNPN